MKRPTKETFAPFLKLCPFCGGMPECEPWHGGAPTKHRVGCNHAKCHARPAVTGQTQAVAVRRWNRRKMFE